MTSKPKERLPDPKPCGRGRCAHCRYRTEAGAEKVAPLTLDDLRWYFESASAMGVRSTHGAFVDMAQSGVMNGGRSNGVEARAVEGKRLYNTGKHSCVLARIGEVEPQHRRVLAAALGPEDWTRSLDTPDREAVRSKVPPELWQVVLLTSRPVAHAVKMALRPSPSPVSRPRLGRMAEGEQDKAERAEGRRAFLQTACGAVVSTCREGNRKNIDAMCSEAERMLRAAIAAAGARQRNRRTGVRHATKAEGKRVRAAPLTPRSDAEVFCG